MSRRKFSRAHWRRLKLMSQLQAQVPDPLTDDLPCLLHPGGVVAPAVRIDLPHLIGKRRFKGAALQIQFDDITGGKPLLRQIGKEEFVDDARAGDANGTLLQALRMSSYDHAT